MALVLGGKRGLTDKARAVAQTMVPGLVFAATAVGAGDLLTASLAGAEAGLAVLWAVPAGIILKWILSENVTRWQMATDTTVLEGWVWRLGRWIQWVFLVYLILFTFVVGGALITACGVAGAALVPLGEPTTSKNVWGIVHSLAGFALVRAGSFELFKTLMSVCIGVMFGTVTLTALLIGPDWAAVAQGIVPSMPPGGPAWVVAVLGGIGGTVTLLSYGYWIREEGRTGREGLRASRLDLTLSYIMIGLFGMAVVIIGSRVQIRGQGIDLALVLADQLALALGPAGKWIFLVGFWATVFSSLMGVWQSLPYLFTDFLLLRGGASPDVRRTIDARASKPYRIYLLLIATVPLVLLWTSVQQIQLAFGILGATFLPLLSLTLLLMNNRKEWVGEGFTSGRVTNTVLLVALLFFGYVGGQEILSALGY